MLTAVIAVLGTLAGSFVTGALQSFAQRAQRAAEELAVRRSAGLDAVAGLSAALADHRRAMAVREEIRLAGGDWSAARAESHATRSAVTGPLLRVRLLLPELADAAQNAAQAAYDMRAADSPAALQEARERALQAADDLTTAAGAAYAG
ncbi:protein kilB (plasmid) [Streptomyces anulatus]|nr:protein kilB [Streptomyces anulatus]